MSRRALNIAPITFILLAAALIAAALALSGCGGKIKPGTAEVKRPAVTGVTLAQAKRSAVADYYETSGTIRAKNIGVLASKVMGTVTAVYVKEGDRVAAGQVLLELEDNDAAARVAAAQAGYYEALKASEAARANQNLAGVTYQRYKELYGDKAISQQEMDQVATQKQVADLELERAQAAVNRARAGLAEAQAFHAYTRLTAPFAGVVTAKKIDPGTMAVPGVPLLVVEDDTAFTLETDVDESLAGRLAVGGTAEVALDNGQRTVTGTIAEIAPAIDPASRKFHLKLSLPGANLKSGLYAKVRFPAASREAILLPATAIVEKGQLTGVYVVDGNGIVTYRLVRTGKNYDGRIEILSGLSDGETVIVNGTDRAKDGGIIEDSSLEGVKRQ